MGSKRIRGVLFRAISGDHAGGGIPHLHARFADGEIALELLPDGGVLEHKSTMKTPAKTRGRILTTDAEIRDDVRRAREREKWATKITSATYDRKRDTLRVDLSTGATLSVPRRSIVGFAKAKPSQLAELELMPPYESLWSESVDDGVLLEQLIVIAIGAQTLGEIGGQINGSKKSPARAAASRRNGVKGGRPRKPAVA